MINKRRKNFKYQLYQLQLNRNIYYGWENKIFQTLESITALQFVSVPTSVFRTNTDNSIVLSSTY